MFVSDLVQRVWVRPRSLPQNGAPETCLTGISSNVTHKYLTRLEKRARVKHSSLLQTFLNQSCKKFYNIGLCSFIILDKYTGIDYSIVIYARAGKTKGGSIIVPLTSCLTGLDQSVLQIKTKFVSCHTAHSKPVKSEVNGTVILPPLVFPGQGHQAKLYLP